MNIKSTTKTQVGTLDGPFQVFHLIIEEESSPGQLTVSEVFLVWLDNFGPIIGFAVESLAVADARFWNEDFSAKLDNDTPQKRLNEFNANLSAERKQKLRDAMDQASKKFREMIHVSEKLDDPPSGDGGPAGRRRTIRSSP